MIKFESAEELHFSWYIDELVQNGFIKRWKYQPEPFPLSDKVTFTWQKQLKTKQKVMVKTLLQEHKYQADFLIIWAYKAAGIFFAPKATTHDILSYPFVADFSENYGYRTVIDVKGEYNQNDAWRRFSIDQKWVWQRYKVPVQKIIPKKLFPATFTPLKYLQTDQNRQARKIKYKPVLLLPQFLDQV